MSAANLAEGCIKRVSSIVRRVSELSREFLDPEASFDPVYLAARQTTVD